MLDEYGTRQTPFTIISINININININCLSSLRGNLETMADNEEIGLEEVSPFHKLCGSRSDGDDC
jgi:hypothetical protein